VPDNKNEQTPAQIAETVFDAMSTALEQWKIILDGLDGHVAEAMRRGWTKEQAHAIVFRMLLNNGQMPDDSQ